MKKEHTTEVDKKKRRLSGKELGYLRSIAQGKTRRQAVLENYDVKDDIKSHTLDNMASAIEKRPQVLEALEAYQVQAQQTVIDVVEYSKAFGATGSKEGAQYARVAVDGANSLIDRIHGKARQQIDVQSTTLAINVNLQADTDD